MNIEQRDGMSRIAYVNGEFMPLAEAKVSILDRGFLFADGVYEVSAVLDGRLIDNASHLARLERSVGEIELSLPVSLARLVEIQKDLIHRNGLVEGLVYLEVTRGAGERDFLFPRETPSTLVLFTQAKSFLNSSIVKTGISVKTVPDIRWARRDIKSVGLLAQVLAKQAAAAEGCQEAWLVENGIVTEGASSSAFIITQDGVLVTGPISNAILPGCTRKATLKLADEHGLPIEERTFTTAEAYAASEAFITSASSFVTAVVRIDGRAVGKAVPGPLTTRLREIYVDFCRTAN